MAVEVTPYGQIQEFLQVLKRRRWQIALPALFVLLIGSVFAVVVPKKYVIETEVELREARIPDDAEFRKAGQSPTDREIGGVVGHIRNHARIERVVKETQDRYWPQYLKANKAKKFDIIESIRDNLVVNPRDKKRHEGSTFIRIVFKDTQAERGEEFLKGITNRALEDIFSLATSTLERERDQVAVERDALLTEATEASQTWKDRASLAGQDPTRSPADRGFGNTAAEDPIFAQVAQLEATLSKVALEYTVLESEITTLSERYEREEEFIEREEVQGLTDNSLAIAQTLERLDRERAKLAKLTPRYSGYQEVKELVESGERILAELIAKNSAGVSVMVTEPNPVRESLRVELERKYAERHANSARQGALSAEIEDAKDKALRWGEELATLQDLWDAKESSARKLAATEGLLDIKERAFRQQLNNNLEFILDIASPANASDTPEDPNPWLIVAFSLFAGLGLGLAGAFVSEYARNSYRTVPDLARVMTIPVLGSIGTIVTQRERRRARALRFVVGTSSLVILLGTSWVTWVWSHEELHHMLPVTVLEAIDDFQLRFMGL